MNCYVCATRGEAAVAIASCRHCSAGLCLDHLREAALHRSAGGMNIACSHDTWSESAARMHRAALPVAVADADRGRGAAIAGR